METKRYWPTSDTHNGANGSALELRASLAWYLLGRFALVAGHTSREDSAGRAVIDLMSPEDTVARAFRLADLFVDEAERRGELRAFTDDDVRRAMQFGGEMARVHSQAEYPRGRWREDIGRLEAEAGTPPQGS